MQAMLASARSKTTDWRYPHVGDLTWSFFLVLVHLDPHRHVRLWRGAGGEVAAYAMLGEDPTFDVQVHPDHLGEGLEDEALAWCQALQADLGGREPDRCGGPLTAVARRDDRRRIAFLEDHGFLRRDESAEVNLMRSLDEPFENTAPPVGCTVRTVAGSETEVRAAIQAEVWQPWPCGRVDGQDYSRLMRLPGYHRRLDLVAVADDGVIAAYANGWLDPVNRLGDFGPVGARAAYRRRGFTRAVLVEGLRRMRESGMLRACVSTQAANTAAIGLYRSVGFELENQTFEYERPGDE
jgi:GNAT superfamily N-acetyltransferase